VSYPKRADLFKKWSEAMLRGATVDKPTYSEKSHQGKKNNMRTRRRSRLQRFRRRKRKKEE